MTTTNTSSGFQANGVLASIHQGDLSFYLIKYRMCTESGRPALVWLDSKWAKESISENRFNELKGAMVMQGNAFFQLK